MDFFTTQLTFLIQNNDDKNCERRDLFIELFESFWSRNFQFENRFSSLGHVPSTTFILFYNWNDTAKEDFSMESHIFVL